MELAVTIFNIGVGVGLVLVGAALVVLVLATLPLLRESRGLVADSRRLADLADAELRPILASARELTANVEVLSEDVAVKLDRLTDLMNSLQHTLETVEISAAPRTDAAWPADAPLRTDAAWLEPEPEPMPALEHPLQREPEPEHDYPPQPEPEPEHEYPPQPEPEPEPWRQAVVAGQPIDETHPQPPPPAWDSPEPVWNRPDPAWETDSRPGWEPRGEPGAEPDWEPPRVDGGPVESWDQREE